MAQNDGMRGPSPHPEYDDGGWQYYEPGVSDTLRQARESQGHELRDVSKELRIRHDYMLAIEEGRYHDLPGTTYAIGFVRSYADYLGLDSNEMVQRFKDEVRDLAAAEQNLSFPAPKPEGRIPGVALVLISVLLIALVYGAWYLWDDQGRPYVELLPGVSDEQGASDDDIAAEETTREDEPDTAVNSGSDEEEAGSPVSDSGESEDQEESSPSDLENDSSVSMAGETDEAKPAVDGETSDQDAAEDNETSASLLDESVEAVDDVTPTTDSLPDADSGEGQQDSADASGQESDGAAGDDTEASAGSEEVLAGTSLGQVTQGTQDTEDTENSDSELAEADTGSSEDEADSSIPDLPGSEEEDDEDTESDSASGRIYGDENDGARIVLEATSDSWVQVRDGEGELIFTRVLRAGESYRVPDEEGMTLLTGNAGGLDIRVDGDTVPSLGGMGTVRRDVPLNPQQLSSGALQE